MQKAQTAEEIILKLRKIEISVNQGKSVRMSCREEGISVHTYYEWRREYGGLNVDQARELKKLKLDQAIIDTESGKACKYSETLGDWY